MTHFSRRELLQTSLLATAALTLNGSQKTFAQDEEKKKEEAPKKTEKLRVAVVGINGRGNSHIGGFGSHEGCEIAALVDADETVLNNRADEVEKKWGKRPTVYTDMRKCFDDKSIDIVSIATPN